MVGAAALRHRQFQLDLQSGLGIAGADIAVVELDGAARDRETETDSAAGAIAVGLHAIEGIEKAGQGLRRDAGAAIADIDDDATVGAGELDLDGSFTRGVADRVADDVLDG